MNNIKTDILYKLNALIVTLSDVRVSGEKDCEAMFGSLKLLRDLCAEVSNCDIKESEKKPGKAKEE
jgi:hypothetical protein